MKEDAVTYGFVFIKATAIQSHLMSVT